MSRSASPLSLPGSSGGSLVPAHPEGVVPGSFGVSPDQTMVAVPGLREAWLTRACDLLIPLFDVPPRGPWRITCGWPSTRGTAATSRRLAECWSARASRDGTIEVIVSIALDAPLEVLGVVAHELVHACLPDGAGHGPDFARKVRGMGLTGKPTATVVGPAFEAAVAPVLALLGPFPGARLDVTQRRKQSTRMMKAACEACGYTVRVTRKWLAVALPCCPVDGVEMVAEVDV